MSFEDPDEANFRTLARALQELLTRVGALERRLDEGELTSLARANALIALAKTVFASGGKEGMAVGDAAAKLALELLRAQS